jgi:hypothetical protein
VVQYVIDPAKIDAFERFAWTELVNLYGGIHHGFLPPSLAAYEEFGTALNFVEADRIRDESGCVLRYERTFMRPLLPSYGESLSII